MDGEGAALASIDPLNNGAGGGANNARQVVLTGDLHVHLVSGTLAVLHQVGVDRHLAVIEAPAGHVAPAAEPLTVGPAEAQGAEGAGAIGLGVEVGPTFAINIVEAQVAAAAFGGTFTHLQGELGGAGWRRWRRRLHRFRCLGGSLLGYRGDGLIEEAAGCFCSEGGVWHGDQAMVVNREGV